MFAQRYMFVQLYKCPGLYIHSACINKQGCACIHLYVRIPLYEYPMYEVRNSVECCNALRATHTAPLRSACAGSNSMGWGKVFRPENFGKGNFLFSNTDFTFHPCWLWPTAPQFDIGLWPAHNCTNMKIQSTKLQDRWQQLLTPAQSAALEVVSHALVCQNDTLASAGLNDSYDAVTQAERDAKEFQGG